MYMVFMILLWILVVSYRFVFELSFLRFIVMFVFKVIEIEIRLVVSY